MRFGMEKNGRQVIFLLDAGLLWRSDMLSMKHEQHCVRQLSCLSRIILIGHY